MTGKIHRHAAAVLAVGGLALAGCGDGKSDPDGTKSTSKGSSIVGSGETDGLKILDSLRNVSGKKVPTGGDIYASSVKPNGATPEAVMAENQKPHADSNDADYKESSATTIQLDGTPKVSGKGASATQDAVTIKQDGTYVLSGSFNGTVTVEAPDTAKVKIVLKNANISSSKDSAIRVKTADEAVVIAAEGTSNSLSDTSSYAGNAKGPSAALASSADLTVGGKGELKVTGNANDGISSSDGLVVTGGKISVSAPDDAVRGQDYVVIAGGTLDVNGKSNGIKSENETKSGRGYVLVTGGDLTINGGSSNAVNAKTEIVIAGGNIKIAGSKEGIEAAHVLLAGGKADVKTTDDGINATGVRPWLSVSGGEWRLDTGGDGFDSNGAAYIGGGKMTIYGPTDTRAASLDAETGLEIDGGTLFAAGPSGMDETPSSGSSQTAIKVDAAVKAQSTVTVVESGGKELAKHTLTKDVSSIFFSSADLAKGKEYKIVVDGHEIAKAKAGEFK